MKKPLSVTIEAELVDKLDELSVIDERSRSWEIEKAIAMYLDTRFPMQSELPLEPVALETAHG